MATAAVFIQPHHRANHTVTNTTWLSTPQESKTTFLAAGFLTSIPKLPSSISFLKVRKQIYIEIKCFAWCGGKQRKTVSSRTEQCRHCPPWECEIVFTVARLKPHHNQQTIGGWNYSWTENSDIFIFISLLSFPTLIAGTLVEGWTDIYFHQMLRRLTQKQRCVVNMSLTTDAESSFLFAPLRKMTSLNLRQP